MLNIWFWLLCYCYKHYNGWSATFTRLICWNYDSTNLRDLRWDQPSVMFYIIFTRSAKEIYWPTLIMLVADLPLYFTNYKN